MVKFILFLLNYLRPFYTKLGINFEQMRAIVAVKLTIDNRIEKNGRYKENSNHTLLYQIISMAVIGSVLFFLAYFVCPLEMTLMLFHSYLCLVVITSFMAEYSNLLFNSIDNEIVERFPVTNRTVLASRITSMLSYLYLLTFSLSIFPYLLLNFKEGFVEALLFLIAVLFNTFFSLLVANLFYIGLMRFLSAEKFRKIIIYVQTFLFIGLALSYQFVGRISQTHIDLLINPPFWVYFTPPCYFMAITEVIRHPGTSTFILVGLSLLLTFGLLLPTLYCFSDNYISQATTLEKISSGKTKKGKERIALFLSRICCFDSTQRCGFLLTWRLTNDNLKFKQSVLPLLIYILIINLLPLYQMLDSSKEITLETLLFPLYMLPFICTVVITNLNYSEQNNLFWIYASHPLKHPGAILLGSLKAIYFKYCIFFFAIFYTIYGIFAGTQVLPDLLLAFSLSTLFLLIYYRASRMVFPFTKEKSTRESGTNIIRLFGTVLLLVLLGSFHALVSHIPWGTIICLPLSWLLIYFVQRQIFSLSLTKIESHY